MSILGSNMLAGAAGRARYEIERSLRFNSNDSAYLNRTPATLTNTTTNTFSAWVKRSGLADTLSLWAAGAGSSNNAAFYFDSSDRINVAQNPGSGTTVYRTSTQVFRDTSAWYHIVLVLDTSNATAQNRIRIYVNNDEITVWTTNTTVGSGATFYWNSNSAVHAIGANYNSSALQYFPGYIAEVNFIDGQALTPSSFGETDLETGAWIPRQYNGSYGTNGFYLKFADNSGVTATTLGKDSSGNGNNWTPSGFQVSTPGGMDSMEDTPTNNWCTFNSAANTTGTRTLRDGNLDLYLSGAGAKAVGTFLIPLSGKWYWEMMANDSNSNQAPGVLQHDSNFGTYDTSKAASYFPNGEYKIESANQVSGFSTYTAQDIISFAVDADVSPPEIYFAKNGTWQNSADPAAGTNGLALTAGKRYLPYIQHGSSSSSSSALFNFGQRQFSYTPPTGFRTLNAKNLPIPTIHDGTKYFNTVLYTGNGSTQSVTGVGFQPDFTWIKGRGSATYNNHILTDVVRGAGNLVQTNVAVAEAAAATSLTSFDSDGFSLGAFEDVNTNSNTYVAWNWKAGGAASYNFDGSISGLVSANPEAGFSIVAYTGTGSETTVGHGLGVSPDMIWVKNRDANEGWIVDSRLVTGNANGTFHFNTDAEYTGGTNQFGTHSSSIFTIKTSGNINTSNQDYVAYVFSEVEGYSKFGTYTGNGSTDGTYVTTNFQPAFVLVKRIDSTDSWQIHDVSRAPYNPSDKYLLPDSNGAEGTITTIDFLSNGFKLRNSSNLNNSGGSFLYMAFAEMPFKHANAR